MYLLCLCVYRPRHDLALPFLLWGPRDWLCHNSGQQPLLCSESPHWLQDVGEDSYFPYMTPRLSSPLEVKELLSPSLCWPLPSWDPDQPSPLPAPCPGSHLWLSDAVLNTAAPVFQKGASVKLQSGKPRSIHESLVNWVSISEPQLSSL